MIGWLRHASTEPLQGSKRGTPCTRVGTHKHRSNPSLTCLTPLAYSEGNLHPLTLPPEFRTDPGMQEEGSPKDLAWMIGGGVH